jgi:small neutral amino acid transporter SnatA (MarC family)
VTVDPLGTVPLYLSVTQHLPAAERKRAAVHATIISFALLAAFLYFWQILLNVMRIELLSFQIAGGIISFLFSLSMIFSRKIPTTPRRTKVTTWRFFRRPCRPSPHPARCCRWWC